MSTPIVPEHCRRRHVHVFPAPAEKIFPLLCPVREYDWLPCWQARMIRSQSGLAEAGAVFATPGEGGETIWYVLEYALHRQIRFLRLQPEGVLVEILAQLAATDAGHTRLDVEYCYSALNERGVEALQQFTLASWQAMMQAWETHMTQFLARP